MFLFVVSLRVLLVSKWAISVMLLALMLRDRLMSSVFAFFISSIVSILVLTVAPISLGIFISTPTFELRLAGIGVGEGEGPPGCPGFKLASIIFFIALIPSQQ